MEEILVKIFDTQKQSFEIAEISLANFKSLPLKKDGWLFNWRKAYKMENSSVYMLSTLRGKNRIEGIVQFKKWEGMIVMELIEIHPENKGKLREYDDVAGCLISLGCKLSFELTNKYKGFLTFQSKTKLIGWYKSKYLATQSIGQLMYIDPQASIKLIEKYLNTINQ